MNILDKFKSNKNEPLHEKQEFANVRELVEWAADTYGNDIAYSFRQNPHAQEIRKMDGRLPSPLDLRRMQDEMEAAEITVKKTLENFADSADMCT